ncbi:MAG: N-6 DNA methylase [Candidatus Latescibacteria bacterium]|nr:N-6 DNA methylase [Candidatus Latescibacterota bacterium]
MTINDIFDKLGLNKDNGLYILSEGRWKGLFSRRTEDILEKVLKPYAFFIFNNEPLILFFVNPVNPEKLFKQIWNFNHSPVVFIVSENDITIYNGFSFIRENKELEILTDSNALTDFEYFKIVTGEAWDTYSGEIKSENRVDEKLLRNIEELRKRLTKVHNISPDIANYLIGRIIFIRYLIDRNVIIEFNNWGQITKQHLCNVLRSKNETYRLFEYLRSEFNGNLFPVSQDEKGQVSEAALKDIIDLLEGVELATGQLSLFDVYDFSIIPVELISNIYEFFIGKQEQEKYGAYYTPLFLVDYVLNETVGNYFSEHVGEYDCRILDPACGSGVFLVEALRKIIIQYRKNNPEYKSDLNKYKSKLKELLTENIFGIDKDKNAISVAIFSLYITLLDYLEPPEIYNFKFPELLNKNFFISDFFDLHAEYNEKLKAIKFNFILGNPPWGKIEESEKLYDSYWKNRQKQKTITFKEKTNDENVGVEIKISDKQIAQAFLIRVSDFSFEETAFVITSKILYNLKTKTYRKYLLSNFKIRKIFELSSVRHSVFDKSNDPSVNPASIIFYSYSPDEKENRKNIVHHISLKPNLFFKLFKLFVIEKYDQKKIYQSYFMDYDWLFKVLVYGNILDFYLIKRLKDKFQRIISVISNENNFIYGQGVQIGGGDEYSVRELIGKPFVDTKKGDLKSYFCRTRDESKWKHEYVHRNRDLRLYQGTALLVKKGITDTFNTISAISYEDRVFTDSVTAIKLFDDKNTNELKSIEAILNSNFFSYYIFNVGSSTGIEREQGHNIEKFNSPFVSSPCLIDLVTKIEHIQRTINENKLSFTVNNQNLEYEYQNLLSEIENEIEKLFMINSQEKSLIDYTDEISIPLIKKRDKNNVFRKIAYEDEYLEKYAKIFINHFNNIYNSDGNFFNVEILYSPHIIGMNFSIIPFKSKTENQMIWLNDDSSVNMLNRFALLSFKDISYNLFVQKDIKGFEENSFYVIKPNEYKLWHQAIAYLDLSEFIDAITKSGMKQRKHANA